MVKRNAGSQPGPMGGSQNGLGGNKYKFVAGIEVFCPARLLWTEEKASGLKL